MFTVEAPLATRSGAAVIRRVYAGHSYPRFELISEKMDTFERANIKFTAHEIHLDNANGSRAESIPLEYVLVLGFRHYRWLKEGVRTSIRLQRLKVPGPVEAPVSLDYLDNVSERKTLLHFSRSKPSKHTFVKAADILMADLNKRIENRDSNAAKLQEIISELIYLKEGISANAVELLRTQC